MSKRLVVSKYKEDISWSSKINFPITVYSKDPDETDPSYLRLPNIGREAHTILYHITQHYYNLDDLCVFTQGTVSDHKTDFVDTVNNLDESIDYVGLGGTTDHIRYMALLTPQIQHEYAIIHQDITGRSFPPIIKVWRNGIFAVSKRNIHRRPLSFYKKYLEYVSREDTGEKGTDNPAFVYAVILEFLWTPMFRTQYISRPFSRKILPITKTQEW